MISVMTPLSKYGFALKVRKSIFRRTLPSQKGKGRIYFPELFHYSQIRFFHDSAIKNPLPNDLIKHLLPFLHTLHIYLTLITKYIHLCPLISIFVIYFYSQMKFLKYFGYK